jgi:hypothetical protein
VLERALVIEAEHLVVVLGLGQLDFSAASTFLEREEVERLGVAKHAVEIEQHRVRPTGHGREAIGRAVECASARNRLMQNARDGG